MKYVVILVLLLATWCAGCSRPGSPAREKDGSAAAGPEAVSAPQPAAVEDAGAAAPVAESASAYRERRENAAVGAGHTDPEAVGTIVQCATCHGAQGQGNQALGAPRIGGLAEWYVARQLKYFRAGLRGEADEDVHGTQMRAIALPLEDETIEDLAAYVSRMNPPAAPALSAGDAARGRELYAVCAACHGTDGRGDPAMNTPSLVKQSGSYLVRQLENFRRGLRGSHPADTFGQQMSPIAKSTLQSREDAVDVATYIGSLRGSTAGQAGTASPRTGR